MVDTKRRDSIPLLSLQVVSFDALLSEKFSRSHREIMSYEENP